MGIISLVAGLGYGDESKGACVDYLTEKNNASLIVRYNGGPKQDHHVVRNGLEWRFGQLGSGILANPNVTTLLSEYTYVNLSLLSKELAYLSEILENDELKDNVIIEEGAYLLTGLHESYTRAMEAARGGSAHGTGGCGISAAMMIDELDSEITLRACDLHNEESLVTKLNKIKDLVCGEISELIKSPESSNRGLLKEYLGITQAWSCETVGKKMAKNEDFMLSHNNFLEKLLVEHEDIIFEGSLGALLDSERGEAPHVSWIDTSFTQAENLLANAGFRGEVDDIGCLRVYSTRHGVGPLKEHKRARFVDPRNNNDTYKGKFRTGFLYEADLKAAAETMQMVSTVHLSHVDEVTERNMCIIKEDGSEEWFETVDEEDETKRFVGTIEHMLGSHVGVLGYGPSAEDRKLWHILHEGEDAPQ